MKKLCLVCFAVCLFCVALVGCSNRGPTPNPATDFTYEIKDGSVTITGFTGDSQETALVIPAQIEELPVQEIAPDAFLRRSFTSVYIPDSVVRIGEGAFQLNEKMATLRLPDMLCTMGTGAFRGTSALQEVVIPGTLREIPDGAFEGSGLKKLTLGEGITTVGEFAFYGTGIQEVVTPSSMKEIKSWAFCDCAFLASITLNEGLVSVGDRAFGGRGATEIALTEVTIPSTVTEITEAAFAHQSKLTSVTFKGNAPTAFVSEEGMMTFDPVPYTVYYHEDAKGFEFPRWYGYRTCVIEKKKAPIPNENGLEYKDNGNGGITIVGYCGEGGDVVIPNAINGKPVTEVGFRAFLGCDTITSVELSPSLECVEVMAFYDCKALKSVVCGEDLQRIKKEAFCYCRALDSITLPDDLYELGERAFRYCTALREITLPRRIALFGEGAFEYSGLERVTMTPGLGQISVFAFGCTPLREVVIPGSIGVIPKDAFSGCEQLERVILSPGCGEIGEGAFSGCSALTAITMPPQMRKIGAEAFSYCSALTAVTLNEGLTSVGDHAFERCEALREIVIPATVTEINQTAFYRCSALEAVKFLGNAPAAYEVSGTGEYYYNDPYIVYYVEGAEGFTPEVWCGYESKTWQPPTAE